MTSVYQAAKTLKKQVTRMCLTAKKGLRAGQMPGTSLREKGQSDMISARSVGEVGAFFISSL